MTNVDSHWVFKDAIEECLKDWQFEASDVQARQLKVEIRFLFDGKPDQRIVHYKVSGAFPDRFQIEVNPYLHENGVL